MRTCVAFVGLISGGPTHPSVREFQKPPRDVFRYALRVVQKNKSSFRIPRKGLRLPDDAGYADQIRLPRPEGERVAPRRRVDTISWMS
jgi:hypothetical protein